MRQAPWILIVGITAFIHYTLPAQTPEAVFSRGNDMYRAGTYQAAEKEYESIIKQGKVSAELYFNLGNAYYRDGQLARAILCTNGLHR